MSDSRGKLLVVKRYDRAQLRRNPNTLFVFGDNYARVGYGGQAAEARGEPNAVGIVTKMSPSIFLSDGDHETVKTPIVAAFVRLAKHLDAGGNIVWPEDGVGTGLARLEEVAPNIFLAIEKCREHLFGMASSVIVE